MATTLTPKDLQDQLTRYFNGDINRVKTMVRGCNAIGFKMSDHLEEISKNPEAFMILITYSDCARTATGSSGCMKEPNWDYPRFHASGCRCS